MARSNRRKLLGMKQRIAVIAVLLTASFTTSADLNMLHAQQSGAQLTGRVIDPSGAGVQDAAVILYQWNTETRRAVIREVARFNTDSFGEFSGRVPLGKYDLFVLSSWAVPVAQRITVTSQPPRISVRLSPDPDLPMEGCCDASVPTVEVKPEH